MEAPKAWKKFLSVLWRGSLEEAGNENDWVKSGLKKLSQEERYEIINFIDLLFESRMSSKDLCDIWNMNSNQYYIGPGERSGPAPLYISIRDISAQLNSVAKRN